MGKTRQDAHQKCEVCGRDTSKSKATKCAKCDYLAMKFDSECDQYLQRWSKWLQQMLAWREEDKKDAPFREFLKNNLENVFDVQDHQ